MDHASSAKIDFAARLAALRAELSRESIDGYVIPRGDEHLGEYVPPSAQRLAWISGFTGSAGLAVVLTDHALVWSDGRYVTQIVAETDPALWQRLHSVDQVPSKYLAKHFPRARIGYDPWLVSEDTVKAYAADGVDLVPVARNLIDAVWHDRPSPPLFPAHPHDIDFSGETSEAKRQKIADILTQDKVDAAVITDPASVAWLLNIRGEDVECTPFALGFMLARADGHVDLFMAPEKLTAETRAFLGNQVALYDRADLPSVLAQLAGKRVRVDGSGSPVWFATTLRAAGADIVAGADPCAEPRACKNPVEQDGARHAHAIDAVALCRFLHWFAHHGVGSTELDVVAKLHGFRKLAPEFRGDSFPAIAGAGEDGAIIHYRVTDATNRAVRADEIFLIDSGGQYFAGTTDVTRTLWTGPGDAPADWRRNYTLVLKGHVALASLQIPDGCPGVRIDAFARSFLWQAGLDYDHGTGHGVGSYLSVHEGPISISPYLRPAGLRAGMIVSNEPGYYVPGAYGIRIENLVLTYKVDGANGKKFLRFENLTLAPYERQLIDVALLTDAEKTWIDDYHARVLASVGPRLEPQARAWLEKACAPL